MDDQPFLAARGLRSERRSGIFSERLQFRLSADFQLAGPGVVGVLGSNGAGKTTLFDLLAGNEAPTSGQVLCAGRDLQRVHPADRGRLVNHRRQRHHTRGTTGSFWNGFRSGRPTASWLRSYQRVNDGQARVHLFDEPDLEDGYLGLLLNFIRDMREAGNLVLISAHPVRSLHLDVIRNLCDSYLFLDAGQVQPLPDFTALSAHEPAQLYLGELLEQHTEGGEKRRRAAAG